ncbi:A-kinase-interacting protein 1-like, partial [Clarias magur]
MAGRCWLESSLDRSSKLGLEVLQRAKRRSETWKSVGTSHMDHRGTEKHTKALERSAAHMTLDKAFAKIVECMSETSNQCKTFYRSASAVELQGQERTHVCRFHAFDLQKTSRQMETTTLTPKRAHYTGGSHTKATTTTQEWLKTITCSTPPIPSRCPNQLSLGPQLRQATASP